MKGIPIFFSIILMIFFQRWRLRRRHLHRVSINLEGIFENDKITENKSLTFTDFLVAEQFIFKVKL